MGERQLTPITATVDQFRRLSGLGKTSIFALIRTGELRSAVVSNRRLIILESYRELLERSMMGNDAGTE